MNLGLNLFNAFLGVFVVSSALILMFRPQAVRFGLIDTPGGHKSHEQTTPLVGGLSMFFGFLLFGLLWVSPEPHIQVLFLATGLLVTVGAIDDARHLVWKYRLLAQIIAAGLVVFVGGDVVADFGYFSENVLELGPWAAAFTIFAMVGGINAMNMSDGIDGLAGGLALVTLSLLAFVAWRADMQQALVLTVILIGAVTAFLAFNIPHPWRKQASVFMGDAGSMFLGFVIAWLMIQLTQGGDRAMNPVTALWLFAVPLFDTVSIIFGRLLLAKSPFSADRMHLHHILMEAGFDARKTVLVLLMLSLIFGLIGLVGLYAKVPDSIMLTCFLLLFGLYFYKVTHTRKTTKRGQTN